MSYLRWHVGMKVVCIKQGQWVSDNPNALCGERDPVYGQIYTIREINAYPDGVFIRLMEIVNPQTEDCEEADYLADGFRPVQPRKTDISIFTAMLTTKKRTVDA